MNELKEIVVIYHDQCRDGFGAAYAAWKKFGDTATYVPLKTQAELPTGLENKEIYILDYSFDKATLENLSERNKLVKIIDHHKSAEEAVKSFPDNIFDINHSGAVLSWAFFHPDTETPSLLKYIEDHDIWKFKLPKNKEFNAALGEYKTSFEVWDKLIEKLKKEEFLKSYLSTGKIISDFEDRHIKNLMQYKERIIFEGHKMWALNVSRTYRSILGHKLASLNEENEEIAIGIVYYRNQGAVHISLRSNGDVDVSKIAEKYGGGGHKNAASIRVDSFASLPFTYVED